MRNMYVRSLLIGLVCFCLILIGCGFASFVAAAEEDIPLIVNTVAALTMVVGPGVSVIITAAGTAALVTLKTLCGSPQPGAKECDATSIVGQYQAATDAGVKLTLLQKIKIALEGVGQNLADIVQAAGALVPGISQSIITAVNVIVGLVTALLGSIPALSAHLRGATAIPAASYKTIPRAKDAKKAFNAAISTHFPQAVVI